MCIAYVRHDVSRGFASCMPAVILLSPNPYFHRLWVCKILDCLALGADCASVYFPLILTRNYFYIPITVRDTAVQHCKVVGMQDSLLTL